MDVSTRWLGRKRDISEVYEIHTDLIKLPKYILQDVRES